MLVAALALAQPYALALGGLGLLDDGESREGLTQLGRVSKASVVLFFHVFIASSVVMRARSSRMSVCASAIYIS